jgi:hypothetical protein
VKWILWIFLAIVLAVGLIAAAGAMLPLRHHASRRARFKVAPDALYAVLAGPPDWRTGVKSFGALPDTGGQRRWWEEDSHRQRITYELMEDRPGARLVVRIAEQGLPFGGAWTFEITPAADGGSELRIAEDGEIYNVVFRFLARYFFGYHRSIEQYLRDLGAKFGQAVEIEA